MRHVKRSLLVALVMTTACAFSAEPSDSDVPCLRPGPTVRLLQKQTAVKPTPNGPMTVVMQVPIEVTVLKAEADGSARVQWKRGTMTFVDADFPGLKDNPGMKATVLKMVSEQAGPLLAAMNDLTIELKFDPGMTYAGIANYGDVEACMKKSIDALDELRRKNGAPPLDRRILQTVMNRKLMEQAFAKEPLIYLAPATIAVHRGASADYDMALPNPLGGDAIPGTVHATLDAVPDRKGLQVLRTRTTVDANRFVASMQQAIQKAPGGKPFSDADRREMEGMQITSTAEYHVDPATGLPKAASHKQVVSSPARTQSEEIAWSEAPAGDAQ